MDAMIPAVNRRPGKLWAWLQFPLSRFLIASVAIALWMILMTLGRKLGGAAPESGLSVFLGLVLAALARRSGRVVAPFWKKK